jgi:hypothetical protein
MRHKYKGLSISEVLTPKTNGAKILILDKDTSEDLKIAENECKYHQTEGQSGLAIPYILNGTYRIHPFEVAMCNKTILEQSIHCTWAWGCFG